MKILVLAEKPSQAKDFYKPLLEKVSGKPLQNKGNYFESDDYILAWFYGHLFSAYEPVQYDEKYGKWNIEDLPIIPEVFKFCYKDESAKRQAETIFQLAQRADELVCATDPDREGEGIFRTFYDFYKLNKNFKRLWAVSLADEDLLKAWKSMKDGHSYDMLSAARYKRAEADWLVGMNASRAYSLQAYAKLPIGRVLTATLALIVARDKEVESYKESFSYSLKAKWNNIEFTFFNEDGNKFENKNFCQSIIDKIKDNEYFLKNFKDEKKTENPPRTFNLPELQKDASRKYGFALDKTLELAQKLYEKKVTTYPRTDSQFLPECDLEKYYQLVEKLSTDEEKKALRENKEKPPCVKDTDSAHTAIIPTGEKSRLSEDEEKLYQLIRLRFVTAFMKPREYRQYTVIITSKDGYDFKAILSYDLEQGFKKNYKEEKDESEEEADDAAVKKELKEADLSLIKEKLKLPEIVSKKRAKPKYYTAATLITAMQNCGKFLESEQARNILKETKGIGTPATQATYPVHLEKYGYIKTEKKNFISTPKGRSLIASISEELKSPELTADWEFKLKEMEKGKYDPEVFEKELKAFVLNTVSIIKEKGKTFVNVVKADVPEDKLIACPICGRYLKEWDNNWSCVKDCGFRFYKTIAGKEIKFKQIKEICEKGRSKTIEGFKSKEGKEFSSSLKVDIQNKKVIFDFGSGYNCPKCAKELKNGKEQYYCQENNCGFSLKKIINTVTLSEKEIEKLLTQKKTSLIKGFKTRNGEEFSAYIVIAADGQLKFEKETL